MTEQSCRWCNITKPVAAFYATKPGKHDSVCRECRNERATKSKREREQRERQKDWAHKGGATKTCSICLLAMPATTDYFHSGGEDPITLRPRLSWRCKLCARKRTVNRVPPLTRKQLQQKKARDKAYAEKVETKPLKPPSPGCICQDCGSLPWRVVGPRCRRCLLEYEDEAPVELVFHRQWESAV